MKSPPPRTGRQACELIPSLHWDALISDILMPEQDGLKVINDFRRNHPQAPIVAMSGGGDLVTSTLCLSLAQRFGATAVLPKPFSLDELLSVLSGCAAPQTGSKPLEVRLPD